MSEQEKRGRDRVRPDGSRFGWRRIREGARVRWLGKWYRIEDGPLPRAEYEALPYADRPKRETPKPRYDGSMDGKWGLFYCYGRHHRFNTIHLHTVYGEEWPGPTCVGNVFVWETFAPEVGAVTARQAAAIQETPVMVEG